MLPSPWPGDPDSINEGWILGKTHLARTCPQTLPQAWGWSDGAGPESTDERALWWSLDTPAHLPQLWAPSQHSINLRMDQRQTRLVLGHGSRNISGGAGAPLFSPVSATLVTLTPTFLTVVHREALG